MLGVDRNANKDQIKQAYRTKALRYHPDKTNIAGLFFVIKRPRIFFIKWHLPTSSCTVRTNEATTMPSSNVKIAKISIKSSIRIDQKKRSLDPLQVSIISENRKIKNQSDSISNPNSSSKKCLISADILNLNQIPTTQSVQEEFFLSLTKTGIFLSTTSQRKDQLINYENDSAKDGQEYFWLCSSSLFSGGSSQTSQNLNQSLHWRRTRYTATSSILLDIIFHTTFDPKMPTKQWKICSPRSKKRISQN